jgi:hypothetical protein
MDTSQETCNHIIKIDNQEVLISLVKKELYDIEWAVCEADGKVYGLWRNQPWFKHSIGKMNIKLRSCWFEGENVEAQPFECFTQYPELLDKLGVMKIPIGKDTYKKIVYYKNVKPVMELLKDGTLGYDYEKFYRKRLPIYREVPTDAFNLIMKFAFHFPNYDDKIYAELANRAKQIHQNQVRDMAMVEGMCSLFFRRQDLFEPYLQPCLNIQRRELIQSVFKPISIRDNLLCQRKRFRKILKAFDCVKTYKTKNERKKVMEELQIIHSCVRQGLIKQSENFYISVSYNTGRKDAQDVGFSLDRTDLLQNMLEDNFTQKGTIDIICGYRTVLHNIK